MKRYTWRCKCGTFDLDTREQPLECPVCQQKPKRVYNANVAYHPTKGSK